MKNNFAMVFVTLLTVVFLVACQAEENILVGNIVQKGSTQALITTTQNGLTQVQKTAVKVSPESDSQFIQQTMEVTDPQIKQMMQSQELVNKVVAAGNLEGCSKFKDAYYKESCQVFILAGKAVSKSDTKVCEAGATAKIRDLCKVYVSQKQ
ncbi:MAG TPA: hypothetical protein P5229_04180 [Candidatus Gracilibacteria bacterium]|nr:hypothetical protein [Candidatus Gracilibacteria bacterium]